MSNFTQNFMSQISEVGLEDKPLIPILLLDCNPKFFAQLHNSSAATHRSLLIIDCIYSEM